jgi:5-formyltetrahydrofolate cyclo-ligase
MDKKQLRAQMKTLRASISKPDAANNLRDNFLKHIKLETNSIIASYCPTQNEIDVMPLNHTLIKLGHKICLPIIEGRKMNFHEWDGKTLVEGKFGIQTPSPKTAILKPQYIIIPFVAFDSTKHRLGYGGGFYDQTLEHMQVIKIGVGYAEQEVAKLPVEQNDIQLDYIVTDEKLL